MLSPFGVIWQLWHGLVYSYSTLDTARQEVTYARHQLEHLWLAWLCRLSLFFQSSRPMFLTTKVIHIQAWGLPMSGLPI